MIPPVLYCATTNSGKIREFETAARGLFHVEPLPELKSLDPPEETGRTFEDNAALKAVYYSRSCAPGALVFAEDSGLSVDALDGAPGVYSARFAGPSASDQENNQRLLAALGAQANRAARYVCVIAIAQAGQVLAAFRGEVEGLILDAPRGHGGFGYDPLFYYPDFQATFAEISREQKQTVSHRGRAFRLLVDWLSAGRPPSSILSDRD